MSRCACCLTLLLTFSHLSFGNDPQPDPIVAGLKLQKALVSADELLRANKPAEAVAVLEAELAHANGNRAYLSLLRRAYADEVRLLEATPNADANHLAQAKRKLNLLGGPLTEAASATSLPTEVSNDPLNEARKLLNEGKYAEAANGFARAAQQRATLTESDTAGWAFCRIKLAADQLNASTCDVAGARAAESEVTAALQMVPANAELQKVGRSVIAVAHHKQTNPAKPASTTHGDWQTIETASFRIRYQGSRDRANIVAKAAEEKRKVIFERWSGSPGGAWEPRCEIVLHPGAASYTDLTGQPANGTGHATVKLNAGRVTERRIELRADDEAVVRNALPRELTHIVLADLFPNTPPPKWAEAGMAVLSGDPDEINRYLHKLPDCHREGQLFSFVALMELSSFPDANRITSFYCESVSVVDYLVRSGGAKNFTIFLRDCQRYGTASALKRNYNIESPQALEQAWKQSALTTSRGQQP